MLTWSDVGRLVVGAARWFDNRPDITRISIVSPAGVGPWVLSAGALVAGVDINPIYEDALPEERAAALDSVAPTAIAVGQDQEAAGVAPIVDIDELLASWKADPWSRPHLSAVELADAIERWSTTDPAILLQSTGTTGPPTVIELGDGAMTSATWSLRNEIEIAHPRFLAFLPAAHTSHLLINFYAATFFAADVWIGGGVETIVEDLGAARPNVVFGAPLLFDSIRDEFEGEVAKSAIGRFVLRRLARDAARILDDGTITRTSASLLGRSIGRFVARSAGLGAARELFSGTAPLDQQTHAFFAAIGWYVRNTYGLTECGGAATVSGRQSMVVGELGRVVDGLELRLDAEGQILLRGPANMRGKHGQSAVGPDQWLATGDLGEPIGDTFRFTGRISDRVRKHGTHTTFVELDVLAAAAIGRGQCTTGWMDPDRGNGDHGDGDRIGLVVSPEQDGTMPASLTEVRARLADSGLLFGLIDHVVVDTEPLAREQGELGATGKVRRWRVMNRLMSPVPAIGQHRRP